MPRHRRCPSCSKSFRTSTALQQHVLQQHGAGGAALSAHSEALALLSECWRCSSPSERIGCVWARGDSHIALLAYFCLCERCYQDGEQQSVEAEIATGVSATAKEET